MSDGERESLGSWQGSFIWAAPLAPVLAVAIALAALLTGLLTGVYISSVAFVVASILLLVAWLTLALLHFSLGLSTAEHANAANYHQITRHLEELKARFGDAAMRHHAGFDEASVWADSFSTLYEASALDQALALLGAHVKYIESALAKKGQQWVRGDGYMDLFRRVHRAEALWLRLAAPEYTNEQGRIARVRIKSLAPAGILPNGQLERDLEEAIRTAEKEVLGGDPKRELSARITIGDVWLEINRRRDDLWEELLSLRNRLMLTLGLTALLVYGLLWGVVVMGATTQYLGGATLLYLIGAIVGLFDRLRIASHKQRAQPGPSEDYGFGLAQLLVLPHLSGLAAILGVAFMHLAVLPFSLLLGLVESDRMMIEAMAQMIRDTMAWDSIFSLNRWSHNALWAMVFGFAPPLLLSGIKQQAEDISLEIGQLEGDVDALSGDRAMA